jgi:hypothetical protein
MSENAFKKFITWSPNRPLGLNWVVFQLDENTELIDQGVVPSGKELGEYKSYVEAKKAHPDAHITNDAAEAIKYGNI